MTGIGIHFLRENKLTLFYGQGLLSGKAFLIIGNIFTHRDPPSTVIRRKDNHSMNI